jgi:hypothetical protein
VAPFRELLSRVLKAGTEIDRRSLSGGDSGKLQKRKVGGEGSEASRYSQLQF